jgi:tRNA A-37 threonylcarbamoyl transferase component Bud32
MVLAFGCELTEPNSYKALSRVGVPILLTRDAGGQVHGDLNTDNMLIVRQANGIKLVDFHKTGREHVFEDLVALEHSVRINHPADPAVDRLLQIEGDIAGAAHGSGGPLMRGG